MSPLKGLTRKDLVEALESKICVIVYTPRGSARRTVEVTLLQDVIAGLDNRPIGFESIREAALFDMHSVNAVDVQRNMWINIEISTISYFSQP
jgi:hypothetical protein